MTTKEKKAVAYLEKALDRYAKDQIGEAWENAYPGHNAIKTKLIQEDPIGEVGGPETLISAMEYAGYAASTTSQLFRCNYASVQIMEKFEALLRQTDTFKRIVGQQ